MANYTDQEKFALLKKFHDMDTNQDGSLSIEEVKKCCEMSRMSSSKAAVSISYLDVRTHLPIVS